MSLSVIFYFLIVGTEYFHYMENPPKEFTTDVARNYMSHIDWYVGMQAYKGVIGVPSVEGYLSYRFYNKEGVYLYILLTAGVFISLITLLKLKSIKHLGWQRIIILISGTTGVFVGVYLWQEGSHLITCLLGGLTMSVVTMMVVFLVNFVFHWVKSGFNSSA